MSGGDDVSSDVPGQHPEAGIGGEQDSRFGFSVRTHTFLGVWEGEILNK